MLEKDDEAKQSLKYRNWKIVTYAEMAKKHGFCSNLLGRKNKKIISKSTNIVFK